MGSFAAEILPQFGRAFKDPANFRLVDELPFCLLLAIPYYGPEMTGRGGNAYPYVDIAVPENLYTGPRSPMDIIDHPVFIPLPAPVPDLIGRAFNITVEKFIKGRPALFAAPTVSINLGQITVLTPEPVTHIELFAQDTILNPSYHTHGELKIKEWFDKLKAFRDLFQQVKMLEASEAASRMIDQAIKKWEHQKWEWLHED